MKIGGVETLLTHGDRYCTGDVEYQQFRTISRAPAWQAHVLSQPLAARRALAAQARQKSIEHQQKMGGVSEISDVVDSEVITDLETARAHRVIHGHTHRPGAHKLTLGDGSSAERIVLSDWRTTGEALEVRADGSIARHTLT